mmetsp:Transcript_14131/g.26440  ORF Transcript_14131/g.26440 Transcript_14131/m.26440 type:complete len:81 (+) Transcript_14131:636-878(+)
MIWAFSKANAVRRNDSRVEQLSQCPDDTDSGGAAYIQYLIAGLDQLRNRGACRGIPERRRIYAGRRCGKEVEALVGFERL